METSNPNKITINPHTFQHKVSQAKIKTQNKQQTCNQINQNNQTPKHPQNQNQQHPTIKSKQTNKLANQQTCPKSQ